MSAINEFQKTEQLKQEKIKTSIDQKKTKKNIDIAKIVLAVLATLCFIGIAIFIILALKKANDTIDEAKDTISNLKKDVNKTFDNINEKMDQTFENFNEKIDRTFENFNEKIDRTFENINNDIDAATDLINLATKGKSNNDKTPTVL